MKIVLVNPPQLELFDPWSYPPMGLMMIAAYLRQHSIDVEISNLSNVSIEDIGKKLKEGDIYGVTGTTPMYRSITEVCKVIQKRGKKIVIGGIHATLKPFETYETFKQYCSELVVVAGDGELPMLSIARNKDISGILYGKVLDVNTLPFPARDLVPRSNIRHIGNVHGNTYEGDGAATTLITSFGCPYRCNFCCLKVNNVRIRYKNPGYVYEEIKSIIKQFDVRHFRIMDDTFTLNKKRVLDFCRLVKPLNIYWTTITRADRINKELVEEMYTAGCREVCFGVETGDPELLAKMNKLETHEQIEAGIAMAKDVGLVAKVFLLFGFPGENYNTVEATKEFMRRTKPDKFTMSTFVPLPGSPVGDHPEDFGVRLKAKSYEDYWFYYEPGDRDVFMIEYPNEQEMYELRDDLLSYLRSGEWKK